MKTNKEKYTNTDDALAAFKKHREEYECDCTFDKWLDAPCDEDVVNTMSEFGNVLVELGAALEGIFPWATVRDALKEKLEDTPKSEPYCNVVGLRLRPSEKEVVQKYAADNGVTVDTVLRSALVATGVLPARCRLRDDNSVSRS